MSREESQIPSRSPGDQSCVTGGDLCPKECDCDMDNGLNRATCIDQNLISVDVGVPKEVQVYILTHNLISELDNFCFKDAGYLSLEMLNLSYNKIFWIGLHAFSGLEKIVHIDLSNNRLRYLPSDLFWDTPKLTYLDLSSNIFEKLKNEPFLMHSNLQVLNLNSCHMMSLPERLFTRLPNLKKLDLSDNYVVTFSAQVLAPLRKLQRIELKSDYLKCTADFMAVEIWLIAHGVTYKKQCNKLAPNMSEKIISVVNVEKEDVDVNDVWNITKPATDLGHDETTTPMTPFQKFDKEFSAFQAFILGLELGLAFGVIATYIWLRQFCKCGQLTCLQPRRRQNRRTQIRRDGDMRAGLLWNNVISPDLETPPSFRRQVSLPDRTAPYQTYGVPIVREAAPLQVDAIRLPDRAETPPPPYHECRINI
ncbi:unnamed protein product [Chilo suppressalis]|uniref:LRRNT domain-containing protein n=1 Tax=Chilo suppressalis TaxID=168631 RepID=A0ABN8BE93_CHISP|nr:hypothetical protein evm_004221 [Chilo suppressalis]CAH0405253.1 unnamed protein product [Chilo suppressalis]